MATAVQIEVLIDDRGVVQGVNRVVDSVNKIPGAAKPAFNKLTEETKKANDATRLFAEVFGVTIPREVSKTIAAIPGLSTALASAFKASVVLGFIASIGAVVRNFDILKAKAVDLGLSVEAIFNKGLRNALREQQIDKSLEPMVDQVNALKKAAELAGKDGFSQIRDQLRASNEELDLFKTKFDKSIAEQFGAGTATTARIQNDASGFIRQARVFNEEAANRQVEALRRQNAQNLLSIEVQAELAGKNEIEKLRIQLAADLKKIDIAAGGDRSAEGAAQRASQRVAMVKAEQAQENEAIRQELVDGIQAKLQAEAGAAKGEEAIQLEHVARLQAIAHDQQHTEAQLQNERLAAEIETNAKILDLRRAAADQIFDAEQRAAVDTVPEWERSNAQIVADFQKTNRQIDQELRDTVINSQEADRLREANWKDTNARMSQEYATEFESLYNDLTTGSIGQRISAQMRKFFFNILGQWAAAIQSQRQPPSTGGSGSGGFGGLLGSLLGIGGLGTAGSTAASGPFGTPPFVGNNFFEGSDSSLTGSLATAAPVLLGSGTLSSGAGTGTVAGQQSSAKAGILGSLLSSGGLNKLAPLAILSALTLGTKGSGGAIAGGALIGALGLAALYGKSATLTAAVAPYAAFLGPLAGGLVGFGVGQTAGPVAGSLSGAGSGALVGFLAAGPLGALVGGVVGGLVGLFSGLFRPDKHKQADQWIQQQNIIAAINAEVAAYAGFSEDYGTAVNNLEKIKSDSNSALKQQFGNAGVDEWNKLIVPAIRNAEDTIGGYNTERFRRSSINFGLPQFASGGLYQTGTGGAGLAVLHDQEVVMGRNATRRFGAQNLLALNDAANSGGFTPTIGPPRSMQVVVQAIDSLDVISWLRRGGAQLMGDGIDKYWSPSYVGSGGGA
jgi:gas vesicle protein